MQVSVIQPLKVIFEGNASLVELPGEDGEFSVMDFHQTFISKLTRGRLRIKTAQNAQELVIEINEGMARMSRNELVVLAYA